VGRVFGDDALRSGERVLREGERLTKLGQVVGILARIPRNARLWHAQIALGVWRFSHLPVWTEFVGDGSSGVR
jgi:hypothetical protein